MLDAPICSLIHISDPHFGPLFSIDGSSKWWRGLKRIPLVDGLFPHSYQYAGAAAVAIKPILKDRDERGIPALVVHTGDLTASGSAAEFSVGQTFLRHGHYLPNNTLAGLGMDTEFKRLVFDIPGNHDLWSRRSPKALEAFTSIYGGAYPRHQIVESKRGVVHLHGLDSNRSTLAQHRLANGEVSSETLLKLCERLRCNKGKRILQIVCLHHPLADRGDLALALKDRTAIAKAVKEAGADMVLSGHIHCQEQSVVQGLAHFTAGSLCQIGSQPGFWLLDLYATRVVFTSYEIPPGELQFVPSARKSGQLPIRDLR